MKDGKAIGYVSSGGYAHHIDQSMTMGYVDAHYTTPETELEKGIIGEFYTAAVQGAPLYDPNGERMRT